MEHYTITVVKTFDNGETLELLKQNLETLDVKAIFEAANKRPRKPREPKIGTLADKKNVRN